MNSDCGEVPTSSRATDIKNVQDSSSALAQPSQGKLVDSELSPEGTITFVKQLLDSPNPSIEDIRLLLTRLFKFLEKKSENADLTNVLFTQAHSIWKHALKNNCLIRAFCMFPVKLCQRLLECRRYEELLQLSLDSVPSFVQLYGQESGLVISLKYHGARALIEFKKHSDAIKILEEIHPVAIAEMKKNESFPNRLNIQIVLNLAECNEVLGNHSVRLTVLEETEAILMKAGPEHVNTLILRNVKSLTLSKLGRFDEALALMQSVNEVANRTLGEDDILTLHSNAFIAISLIRKGKLKEGLEIFQPLYKAMERKLGKEHPSTVQCRRNIEYCHRKMWVG